jgi:hydroxyacylglutathione hydrolase
MTSEIKTITIPFMGKISVNCYLVKTGDGYILIDTGTSQKRGFIEKELENAGCHPGNLNLIVLTHGDPDHAGNCAYLCQKFGTKSAMHPDDVGMVEHGDMLWNRSKSNILIMTVSKWFFSLRPSDRFTPDITIEEGDDLTGHGFEASVIHIPGHSKGSIGLLTGDGDLFCGDLLGNINQPDFWSVMDDPETANASAAKLKTLEITTVYPGHGRPFPMEQFNPDQST